MYKFENLLKHNSVKEDNVESLTTSIVNKIKKFRTIQATLPDAEEADKKEIEEKLHKLDAEILAAIEEEFELEEEETAADKVKREALEARAIAVGLAKDATEKQIIAAEAKAKKDTENSAKAAEDAKKLAARAVAVGLAATATEDEVKEAEKTAKKKKDTEEDESKKPATSDAGALEKLHKAGKTSVTKEELKAAGFNTGTWGKLGPQGCSVGGYKLYREDHFSGPFTLSKK